MAIDYVRGGNPRCPSLLVGGLMLICLFFACSWWSLTSQNFELLNQITDLEEHIKISADELEKCTQTKLTIDERAKTLQNGAVQQRVKIEQLKSVEVELQDNLKKTQDDLNAALKRVTSLESSLTLKNTELESLKRLDEAKNKTLEALRTEKKTLHVKLLEEETRLDTLKAELAELKERRDPVAGYVLTRGGATKVEQEENDNGAIVNSDHAKAAIMDENNGGEIKVEVPDNVGPEPEKDPREIAMTN